MFSFIIRYSCGEVRWITYLKHLYASYHEMLYYQKKFFAQDTVSGFKLYIQYDVMLIFFIVYSER